MSEDSEKLESGSEPDHGVAPLVVTFAYHGFRVKGGKWYATCKKCSKTLSERRGVTSAVTK